METMSRKSWLFQIAYILTEEEKEPIRVTPCTLVWRVPVIGFFALILSIFFAIVFTLISFFGFFFAKRMPMGEKEYNALGNEFPIVAYKKWWTVRGKRIYPFWVLIFAGLIFLVVYSFSEIISWFAQIPTWAIGVAASNITVSIVGGILIATIAFLLWRKYQQSEYKKILSAAIKARKEKYCPVWKVVD